MQRTAEPAADSSGWSVKLLARHPDFLFEGQRLLECHGGTHRQQGDREK